MKPSEPQSPPRRRGFLGPETESRPQSGAEAHALHTRARPRHRRARTSRRVWTARGSVPLWSFHLKDSGRSKDEILRSHLILAPLRILEGIHSAETDELGQGQVPGMRDFCGALGMVAFESGTAALAATSSHHAKERSINTLAHEFLERRASAPCEALSRSGTGVVDLPRPSAACASLSKTAPRFCHATGSFRRAAVAQSP